jgi:hypothetical protein
VSKFIVLGEVEELRNTYIHSWWGTKKFGDKGFIRQKSSVKGRKGCKMSEEPSIPKDILDLCDDMSSFNFVILTAIYKSCKDNYIMSAAEISQQNEFIATYCSRVR